MENVVDIKNLNKTYGGKYKALNNLSLTVKKGEIFGLLGPNGSGKSTTINCLLSLLNYDSGSIKVFGKEMTPESYDIKSKIGVVFQDVAVFDELTVYENINYFCGLYITDKSQRKKYVQEAIDLVGLGEFKKFYPKQLSGGLLRRLNIACGVAHKPDLIILDEPTVAVDPQSRNNILDGIKKLNEKGATIIYTTHYMEEVEQICKKIVIVDSGQVIASGTKEELKNLISTGEKITITIENLTQELLDKVSKLNNVISATNENDMLYVTYKKGDENLSNLIDFLKSNNVKYSKIFSELPSLNDVFLELTGKGLRD